MVDFIKAMSTNSKPVPTTEANNTSLYWEREDYQKARQKHRKGKS